MTPDKLTTGKSFPSLKKRIVSALLVVIALVGSGYFFGVHGPLVVGVFLCLIGILEYQRLVLQPLQHSPALNILFLILAGLLLVGAIFYRDLTLMSVPLCLALVITGALWSRKGQVENSVIRQYAALTALGLIYVAIVPGLALRMLIQTNGAIWFTLLLIIVFSGDIAAYFGGIIIGGPKMMVNVSPNKTLSGAASGAVGSTLAGVLFVHWAAPTLSISWPVLVIICVVASILAQSGDLFESLLKRVGNVKDSGQFLPGHGGILDRLDGVYFAAPLIFLVADYFNS